MYSLLLTFRLLTVDFFALPDGLGLAWFDLFGLG
jgi:hypothetical protein